MSISRINKKLFCICVATWTCDRYVARRPKTLGNRRDEQINRFRCGKYQNRSIAISTRGEDVHSQSSQPIFNDRHQSCLRDTHRQIGWCRCPQRGKIQFLISVFPDFTHSNSSLQLRKAIEDVNSGNLTPNNTNNNEPMTEKPPLSPEQEKLLNASNNNVQNTVTSIESTLSHSDNNCSDVEMGNIGVENRSEMKTTATNQKEWEYTANCANVIVC